MVEGKFIGTYSIMERVLRDNEYDVELNVGDAIEWIGDAIGLIGVPVAYRQRVTNGQEGNDEPIVIEHYRGMLPCDFHKSIAAREYTHQWPMRIASDMFHSSYVDEDCPDFQAISTLTYRINENLIETSFESGSVELAYVAFAVDSNGFPLIPDDIKFIKAVTAYITERVDRRLWRKGKIPGEVYAESQREWLFYVGAAKTAALLPNHDAMQAIKNQMVRLIPDTNAPISQHRYMGDPSYQRNLNSR